MIKVDAIPFDCGVAWAAAFLAQRLGQETMAMEVLKEAGIADVNKLISIGIDEADLDVLKPILEKENHND